MQACAGKVLGDFLKGLGKAALWLPLVALATFGARSARAEPLDTPPADRAFVTLRVEGSDDDATALADSLRELVARLGLNLHARRADSPPSSPGTSPFDREERARIFVDDRLPDRIEITITAVVAGAMSAPVVRNIARGESPEIVIEEIAHTAHAALESLLSSRAIGLPPRLAGSSGPTIAPPPKAAAAPLPSRRPYAFGLDVAVFGSGREIASGTPVAGGGAAVELTAWRGRWRPNLWIGGTYTEAIETRDAGIVALTAHLASFRAVFGLALLETSFLSVELGAGGGEDLFYTLPGGAGPNPSGLTVTLGPSAILADPVLCGQAVARIRIGSTVRLLAGFDVDYDVRPHRYSVEYEGGTIHTVLAPWIARPSAMIGLCVPLTGTPACARSQ